MICDTSLSLRVAMASYALAAQSLVVVSMPGRKLGSLDKQHLNP